MKSLKKNFPEKEISEKEIPEEKHLRKRNFPEKKASAKRLRNKLLSEINFSYCIYATHGTLKFLPLKTSRKWHFCNKRCVIHTCCVKVLTRASRQSYSS